ncbi:hypothetical protein PRIPAC_82134 [Pristionchus pacificus]|uniref:G protein-coupled receptor n=1 Tax=Pristionchus pacificus TaxID=54126 RepID=A0A2A6CK92_PRIPA|nr:hypothetical protein PRIPAC_82134 [Pristionchus pacificus]|eukprot:PDM78645.1 G protein-coupled receptor [Pristionchus pacificus]
MLLTIVPLGFEGIVCVYSGPCVYLDSDHTCFLVYTLVLHGFSMFNIQMTANFCFRYYVLKRANPDCCFLYALAPESEVRQLIHRYTPQYDFSKNRVIGLTDLPHSSALPSIFLIVLTALPCTLVNVLVGSKIASVKTRATHDSFLKALVFQAVVSQAFLIADVFYVAGQLDIVRSPLQEYGTHTIADCCIICSPLLTMYYVPPYRRWFFLLNSVRSRQVRLSLINSS